MKREREHPPDMDVPYPDLPPSRLDLALYRAASVIHRLDLWLRRHITDKLR